ncbi:MAG: AbrB/MazE/SpoVT family DNA-binding domain-containing protein [Proteobacteria bacterium]|nr:AbrB/MazE/SpoVT family DNA-binding domain-containing protein [Pseudomonadota bacterium]
MKTTVLSSKGQVIIPKPIRTSHNWDIGQELIVIDLGDSVLLKPKKPFANTDIADVAGCLKYSGKPKSIQDMDDAVAQGLREKHL